MTFRRVYDNPAWPRIRVQVLRRDGYLCQIRGTRCLGEASEVDHVVPLSRRGPAYDPSNLRAACAPCNRGHHTSDIRNPSREW